MSLNVLGNHTIPTYCNVAILPVVTKDLPISPRFSPAHLYRDESSELTLIDLVKYLILID